MSHGKPVPATMTGTLKDSGIQTGVHASPSRQLIWIKIKLAAQTIYFF